MRKMSESIAKTGKLLITVFSKILFIRHWHNGCVFHRWAQRCEPFSFKEVIYGKEKISFDGSGNFGSWPGCDAGFLAERARG
jgi:hypothetical protein